jgi:hypothetical protein
VAVQVSLDEDSLALDAVGEVSVEAFGGLKGKVFMETKLLR